MRLLILLAIHILSISMSRGQLVLPGDYPDPTVTKIGDTYWASATTSNWMPAYPLLTSKDLIHWETKSAVFYKLPEWADYYFWAPEISYEGGKVYIYYSAHKKNGNLCVGIASADKPEGPYKDHGALICQEVGSIDGFPMRDENGKLYIIWKEDGNSVGKPTPIWISELNENRTALVGEKQELFRNDANWERNLVEGVSMIKHGEYFYAFYAAGACCGKECNYASGVARSKKLLGPWEKYDRNPILPNSDEWKCQGHGTPIEKDGKFYYMYHAYDTESGIYPGRQGLLKEFKFTADGWIEFEEDDDVPTITMPAEISDEFTASSLSLDWQWSVFQPVKCELKKGQLHLYCLPDNKQTFVAQKTRDGNYQARVTITTKGIKSEPGLAVIGDDQNMVGASVVNNKLRIWKTQAGKDSTFMEKTIVSKDLLHIEVKVENGKDITFQFSADGKTFSKLNNTPIDGSFLPPWDRALRVGVTARGELNDKAVFERFTFNP